MPLYYLEMAARKSSSQDGGAAWPELLDLDAVLLLLWLLLRLLRWLLLLLQGVLLLLKLSGPQTVSTVVPRFQFSRGRRLRGF